MKGKFHEKQYSVYFIAIVHSIPLLVIFVPNNKHSGKIQPAMCAGKCMDYPYKSLMVQAK